MPVATPKQPSHSPRHRDAHNRRLRKIVSAGGVENSSDVRNGTTDYAYQGWRVMWEEWKFNPAGGPVTFVYGNYLDEVWNALDTDGAEIYENYYFLTGVNYSVMAVIGAYNSNGIVEAYEYDPYGRHRVIDPGTDTTYFTSDDTYDELHPGAINNAIRYTGQRFDAESGLMYYKNRYYDPAAGRFIGRDPLGWGAGANRYGYVGGRPTRAVDPLGLNPHIEDQFLIDSGMANVSDPRFVHQLPDRFRPNPGDMRVWIIFNEDRRRIDRDFDLITTKLDPCMDCRDNRIILIARDPSQMRRLLRGIQSSSLTQIDKLYILPEHGGRGQLTYTRNARTGETISSQEFSGAHREGWPDSGPINSRTEVIFFACNFAGNNPDTMADDWKLTVRQWKNVLYDATIVGNTGDTPYGNPYVGDGRWLYE